MTSIPSNLLNSNRRVSVTATQAIQQSNISAGARARLSVIENAIPESLFTTPPLPNREVNIEKVEENVDKAVTTILNTISNQVPTLPEIPPSGLLGLALNALPAKLELPTVAEIKKAVYNKLKEIKRKRQASINQSQILAAEAEKTPFTARRNLANIRNKSR